MTDQERDSLAIATHNKLGELLSLFDDTHPLFVSLRRRIQHLLEANNKLVEEKRALEAQLLKTEGALKALALEAGPRIEEIIMQAVQPGRYKTR